MLKKNDEVSFKDLGHDRIAWLDVLSRLLDTQFRVPGTNKRIGLDPLLGLIPVFGDILPFLFSTVIVVGYAHDGASLGLVLRMVLNVLIDFIISEIPLAGIFLDFMYKANTRNTRLYKEYLLKQEKQVLKEEVNIYKKFKAKQKEEKFADNKQVLKKKSSFNIWLLVLIVVLVIITGGFVVYGSLELFSLLLGLFN